MRTKIVAAFPGSGKTIFYQKYMDIVLDSDSSFFSWVKDEHGQNTNQRNPNFPINYIKYIKQNIGRYEFILVSTHHVVREALLNNCLFFYYIMPPYDKKNDFIKRYHDRGNDIAFIEMLNANWDKFQNEFHATNKGCEKIIMSSDYLETELLKLRDN